MGTFPSSWTSWSVNSFSYTNQMLSINCTEAIIITIVVEVYNC